MLKNALLTTALVSSLALLAPAGAADYGPGVSDDTIKIGNTNPYSGPASAYGMIGQAVGAYFDKVNAEGGINGRRIEFISLDDGYNPSKTVEQSRRLVEQEEVLLVFQGLGTPTNSAVHRYFNQREVPQLFVATGASKWNDPENYPWTMGWQPNYQTEAQVYARYILDNVEDPKIAVLYQNDDYGKDYLEGLHTGLGDKADELIVGEVSYETSDATIDSQLVQLKDTGANVFVNITTPKWASQAIRKIADLGWDPLHLLNSVSNSVSAVLEPAGLDKSVGIISSTYHMGPADPTWADHPAMQEFQTFMQEFFPNGDAKSTFSVYAYAVAKTLVAVLESAGDDLTRENVMKQAASLDNLEIPVLLPGITISTGPDDFAPIEQLQLERFNGEAWELFGDVIDGDAGS